MISPLPNINPKTVRCALEAMLAEDIGSGDVTTALFPSGKQVEAYYVSRADAVMCGAPFVSILFEVSEGKVSVEPLVEEGATFQAGTKLIRVCGCAATILTVERTSLNLLSRLCGIAAKTRKFVALAGGRTEIFDTRKTTPLLRQFEKYAVMVGGGRNHRMGLYDQVLVKDNHLTLLSGQSREEFASLVSRARSQAEGLKVEVEVDNVEQFKALLAAEPDIILLDNMSLEDMASCCRMRDEHAKNGGASVILEASGGISEATVKAISRTGVDRLSAGSLTYGPKVVDIGLDFVA
ncbi:MAG: carboxylating nicotinate-nucleotide diphosphorylase [Candidatus Brocadiia bacterium]